MGPAKGGHAAYCDSDRHTVVTPTRVTTSCMDLFVWSESTLPMVKQVSCSAYAVLIFQYLRIATVFCNLQVVIGTMSKRRFGARRSRTKQAMKLVGLSRPRT